MDSLTPVALAIKERLQCVAFGGFPSTVFFTIRARFRRPIEGIRPLREASFSIPPEAIFNETIAPTSGLLTSDVQLGSDLLIVQTPGGQQDNSRSFRQPDRHTAASGSVAPVPSAQECPI